MTDEGRDSRRPAGVADETVAAAATVTEALEWVERARGRLYDFHHMIGHADVLLGEAAEALADAGHGELAAQIEREVVGRNVLYGRWTFQVVEEFDDDYYAVVRAAEADLRRRLLGGHRHVQEFEMKQRRRSSGRRGHEPAP